MKQKEINKVLDAFVNKDITMKEAETKLLNLFSRCNLDNKYYNIKLKRNKNNFVL